MLCVLDYYLPIYDSFTPIYDTLIAIHPLSASSFKCLMLGDGEGRGCDNRSLYLHHPLALSCSHFQAILEIHVISLLLVHVYVYFYICMFIQQTSRKSIHIIGTQKVKDSDSRILIQVFEDMRYLPPIFVKFSISKLRYFSNHVKTGMEQPIKPHKPDEQIWHLKA